MLPAFLKKNRCPHVVIYGLYGDVANVTAPYRLFCPACKTFLKGPVSLATHIHPIHGVSGPYPLSGANE